ncbi:Putative phospholipase/carboxylesterase/thioesterase, alpha/Beta hydrolase [Septoria linicola]|uniref:Phospholipase/carboxylesterase/thioesterase, alpha/Beta hydrolase n=1 Tax=Septoria linicola TaxID=215465 RepID=A0A9Q9B2D1_9PEZI|nr:putative phospholipase/carboxylesterase/thioesterase, alpha/Beta hydrolase [Septoria linicola]USW56293.1 Putative phospholipase/carboxylesterase/thioesterase, alpha/Beta hydrolase [Septoria linicola]
MAGPGEQQPQQRYITLTELYEVVRIEFASYFASIDFKRRTCVNTMWKKLGLFWRAETTTDDDASSTQCEIYEPISRHTHTVIFLHGRDSTAEDFAMELFESTGSQEQTLGEALPSVKWVFPTAPMIESARFGMSMSQWFDMCATEDPHEGEAEQNPTQAIDIVYTHLSREAAIIGWSNVVLAGISQGAAVGIHALLKQPHKLGGFIGLNAWLPNPESIANASKRWPEAVQTAVMLAHTRDDPVINIKFGEELRRRLEKLGMQVEWHDYMTAPNENPHWVNEPQGVDDIIDFIKKVTA